MSNFSKSGHKMEQSPFFDNSSSARQEIPRSSWGSQQPPILTQNNSAQVFPPHLFKTHIHPSTPRS